MNDYGLDVLMRQRFKIFDLSNQDILKGYKILSDRLKAGGLLSHQEYKFLCWLSHNDSRAYPVSINKPLIPQVIYEDVLSFKTNLCINERRSHLFEELVEYVTMKAKEFDFKSIEILVGGSFIDKANQTPRDIDCVILLPCKNFELIKDDYENHLPVRNDFPNIDVEFIGENLEWSTFWTYSTVTHLGNIPELKEPNVINCVNNSFKSRALFMVNVLM